MLASTLCFVVLPKSTTWLALKSNKHDKCYVKDEPGALEETSCKGKEGCKRWQARAVERAKGAVGRLAVQAKRPRLQVQKAKRQQARQVDAPTMDDFDRPGLARQVAVPTQEGLGQAKQKPNLGDQPRQAPFQNTVL